MEQLNKNGNGTYGLSAVELNVVRTSASLPWVPIFLWLKQCFILAQAAARIAMVQWEGEKKLWKQLDSVKNTAVQGFLINFLGLWMKTEEERIPLV